MMTERDHKGLHILLDMHSCGSTLVPGGFMEKLSSIAGLTLVSEVEHKFPGGGATGIGLLSQSHASYHTWPEKGYVAFDLFSCRQLDNEEVSKVVAFVLKSFGSHIENSRFTCIGRE